MDRVELKMSSSVAELFENDSPHPSTTSGAQLCAFFKLETFIIFYFTSLSLGAHYCLTSLVSFCDNIVGNFLAVIAAAASPFSIV